MKKNIFLFFALTISCIANSADYKCIVSGNIIYQDKPCANQKGATKQDNFRKEEQYNYFDVKALQTGEEEENPWDNIVAPIVSKCTVSYSRCWDKKGIIYSLRSDKKYNQLKGSGKICDFIRGRMMCSEKKYPNSNL
ncbi:hypothetical protein F900_01261 [Acinetobacter modestus]|uniref:DUF4124 domain-containing protein n=1 Tax=Acinetobacter modestus TaxID=1776740 RepID=N9NHE0_9GAMM|nr:hypothetical protein [Acinetobacter modestus]ENX02197.1 hypothetical protein F900_01261 [Acinetobacter modestus]